MHCKETCGHWILCIIAVMKLIIPGFNVFLCSWIGGLDELPPLHSASPHGDFTYS